MNAEQVLISVYGTVVEVWSGNSLGYNGIIQVDASGRLAGGVERRH